MTEYGIADLRGQTDRDCVVAMLSIGLGAEKEVESLLNALGAENIHITANDLDEDAWNRVLKATTGLGPRDEALVREALPQAAVVSAAAWRTPDVNRRIPGGDGALLEVYGLSDDVRRVLGGKIVAGRSFTPREAALARPVAVIGSRLSRLWFGRDPTAAVGATFRVDRTWLTVIGVLEQGGDDGAPPVAAPTATDASAESTSKSGQGSGDKKSAAKAANPAEKPMADGVPKVKLLKLSDAVMVPMGTAKRRLGAQSILAPLERLIIKLPPGSDATEIKKSLEERLQILHRGAAVLTVTAADEVIEQKRATTRLFSYFLLAIALISLVVGGIGIANVMLASLVERIREVGLRRAIGAKRRHILFQFLTEALTICLVGGVAGGIGGMGIAALAAWFTGWNAVFPWWGMLVAIAISTIVGTLAGLYPAITASRISPIEALQGRA